MNHYETLGVPKEASRDEIRRAFRKKAQKMHPDKGGKAEDFYPLQRAYDVLGNPTRREQYDQTGSDGDGPDVRQMALGNIGQMFITMVEQQDIDHTNIVAEMRQAFKAAQAEENTQIVQLRRSIVKREKAMKRVKHKGDGPNILLQMLESDIGQRKHKIDALEQKGFLFAEIFKVLDEYEYQVDERGRSQSPFIQITQRTFT